MQLFTICYNAVKHVQITLFKEVIFSEFCPKKRVLKATFKTQKSNG